MNGLFGFFYFILGSLIIIFCILNILHADFKNERGVRYWSNWIIMIAELISMYFVFTNWQGGTANFILLVAVAILFVIIGIFVVKMYNNSNKK